MHVPAKPDGKFHAIRRHPLWLAVCATVMFGLPASPVHASLPDLSAQPEDLTSLSLEELGNIKITSVSKKPERLSDAAASVFVITAEDIRRSGARNLPEALRLAPNLQVAEASAVGYAISARGMNGSNNSAPNKLLVLIDGRSVYSPLFSGVFWDAQDVMLEDVERIEVISGPGGTLWGVNAVNGVINIITRSSENTQGTLLTTAVGNEGSDVGFRYGAALGAKWRLPGVWQAQPLAPRQDRGRRPQSMMPGHRTQVGFRTDWHYAVDRFTVEGNVYDGSEQQPAPGAIAISGVGLVLGDISSSGANLTARWNRRARRRWQPRSAGLLRPYPAHGAADVRRAAGYSRLPVSAFAAAAGHAFAGVGSERQAEPGRCEEPESLFRLPSGTGASALDQPVRAGRNDAGFPPAVDAGCAAGA